MALLFRDTDKRIELRSSHEGPIGFRHASEAAHYLRKSGNRPGVIAVLRKLLAEHHHVQVWCLRSTTDVPAKALQRLPIASQ